MINWDEMPDWADRVVKEPVTKDLFWSDGNCVQSINSNDDRKLYVYEMLWTTYWPPSNQFDNEATEEHTGLSVDYYRVQVINPTTAEQPYTAECNDIIEALGMNYAEGNVFKANWRRAAERTLGKRKKGNNSRYDAEKMVFFSDRILKQEDDE